MSPATLVRLVLSIVLAIIIWGLIVWETNPDISRTFQAVAVAADDVPPDMLVVGSLPSSTVTIQGPQDVIEDIGSSDLRASIDFSNVEGPGTEKYVIEVDSPSGVRKTTIEPATIDVELDRIVSRTFPIELLEDDARPASVTDIQPSTDVASVQGPNDLVDQVHRLALPVDLDGRRESFDQSVELLPLDSNGRVVPGLIVSPARVELAVTFESTVRNVPIVVNCACVVDGTLQEMILTDAAAIPSTVRISGPSSALSEITEIATVALDISQLEGSDWILDVELDTTDLPETIMLSDFAVDVWVPVDPDTLEVPDVPIQVLGISDGLEASLALDAVNVVVSGDEGVLAELSTTQIKAIADVTNLTPGSYSVDLSIVVPLGVTLEQVSPDSVRVTISSRTTTAALFERTLPPQPGGLR